MFFVLICSSPCFSVDCISFFVIFSNGVWKTACKREFLFDFELQYCDKQMLLTFSACKQQAHVVYAHIFQLYFAIAPHSCSPATEYYNLYIYYDRTSMLIVHMLTFTWAIGGKGEIDCTATYSGRTYILIPHALQQTRNIQQEHNMNIARLIMKLLLLLLFECAVFLLLHFVFFHLVIV